MSNQAKVGKFPVINHFYDINELGEQKQIIRELSAVRSRRVKKSLRFIDISGTTTSLVLLELLFSQLMQVRAATRI